MKILSAFFLGCILVCPLPSMAQSTMESLMVMQAEDSLEQLHQQEQACLDALAARPESVKDASTQLRSLQAQLAEQEAASPASTVQLLTNKYRPAKMTVYVALAQWCEEHPEEPAVVEPLRSILPKGMPSEADRLSQRDTVRDAVLRAVSMEEQAVQVLKSMVDTASADANAKPLQQLFEQSMKLDSDIAAFDGQWFTTADMELIGQASDYIPLWIQFMAEIQRIISAACFDSQALRDVLKKAGAKL